MLSSTIKRFVRIIGRLIGATLITAEVSYAGIVLTDSAVFSANSSGENWNGWIWNTQAPPADSANRWNMYYSTSLDPQNPSFINSVNNTSTNISRDLTAGTHTFLVYGETVTPTLDPQQHFVLSLYFDGNQSAPNISGLYGPTCGTVCAASNWNGLDLYGNSGLGGNQDAQEAGSLIFASDEYEVELTEFSWVVDPSVDKVWAHWDNTPPYSSGSGNPDFVGVITLRVIAVPAPLALTHLPIVMTNAQINRSVMLRDRLDRFADGSRFQNNLSVASIGDSTGLSSGFWKDGNYGMFINASYTDFDRDEDGDLYGFDGDATSFTVGFDRKINDRLTTGIALGYDDIDSSAKSPDGYSGDVEAWGVSLYGRNALPVQNSQFSWYVDGVIAYSDNDIDTKRSGNKGDTDADQFAAEVVIGAERLLDNGIEVSPYAGLHYISTDIGGYTESGPSSLTYEDQDSQTLYALLGGEVSTEKQTGNGWVVWPKTYAQLRAVIDDNDADLKYAFAAAPGSRFQQKVQPFDDYSITLGLGVEGQRSENSSLYARISATVGDEGSFDYGISAGANFNF